MGCLWSLLIIGGVFILLAFIINILFENNTITIPKCPQSMQAYVADYVGRRVTYISVYDKWKWSTQEVINLINRYNEVEQVRVDGRETYEYYDGNNDKCSIEIGDEIKVTYKPTIEEILQQQRSRKQAEAEYILEEEARRLYQKGTLPQNFPVHLHQTYWYKHAVLNNTQDRARDRSVDYWS